MRHLLAVAAALLVAVPARAQESAPPPARNNRLSLSLLGIVAGAYSAEYERPLSGAFSLGASAGYWANLGVIVEQDYSWAEIKSRYYPNEAAPGGAALGVSAGVARVEAIERGECFILCVSSGRLATGPTLGVHLDYSWLLGRRDRFYIGLGLGGKRVFGLRDTETDDYPTLLPTNRVQFGVAF